MRQLSHKKILLFVVIVVIGVVLTIQVITTNNEEDSVTFSPVEKSSVAQSKVVDVTDLSLHIPNERDQTKIAQSLYAYATYNIDTIKKTYSGMIRPGSVINKLIDETIPYVELIVDIPDLRRSYKVASEGGDGFGYYTLYTLCLEPQDMIYQTFECKDDLLR